MAVNIVNDGPVTILLESPSEKAPPQTQESNQLPTQEKEASKSSKINAECQDSIVGDT